MEWKNGLSFQIFRFPSSVEDVTLDEAVWSLSLLGVPFTLTFGTIAVIWNHGPPTLSKTFLFLLYFYFIDPSSKFMQFFDEKYHILLKSASFGLL